MDVTEYFEVNLTLDAAAPERIAEAANWADTYGLGFAHIEPVREEPLAQPTITFHGRGNRGKALAMAEMWAGRLSRAGFPVIRTRVGVPHDSKGVPRSRALLAHMDEPRERYFETRIRLLLPPGADLGALARIVDPHRAGLSRHTGGDREEGRKGWREWFVVQRCSRVGRREAEALSWLLLRSLEIAGVAMDGRETPRSRLLSIEREYVVHDSAPSLDTEWLGINPIPEDEKVPRHNPPLVDSDRGPDTYLPNTAGPEAEQARVFDPALKHFGDAYTAGEPVFVDPELGARWWSAQQRAMGLALRAIAATPWREHLVLRGSAAMPLWIGEQARRPRDLDFVVVPAEIAAFGDPAERMLTGIVDAVTGAGSDSDVRAGAGAGADRIVFDARNVRQEGIWTYERAQGKRLVLPWRAEGLPPGTVQVDVVFHEVLPVEPVRATVTGAEVLTADQELSLAWKVQWLFTDTYPQGKDLYDAVLLAERTPLSRDLLVPLLRPELGDRAEEVDETALRLPGGPSQFDSQEWEHFVRDCPWVEGGPGEWINRFEAALAPTFRELRDGPHS